MEVYLTNRSPDGIQGWRLRLWIGFTGLDKCMRFMYIDTM